MTVTATIVQARMASTRLPGKVLLDLGGQTVLSHVIERCRAVNGVDLVCCAVPDTPDCDPVAMEAGRCGAVVFRGLEHDVLDRYYKAAQFLGADVILRVTSDCPLLDPAICGVVLQRLAGRDVDYACNNMPPTWPHGLDCEAFHFAVLEKAVREATTKQEREHVTPFIRSHPGIRIDNVSASTKGLIRHRWTLDTEADFHFLRAIFERLPQGRDGWGWCSTLAIVEKEPELARINAADIALERLQIYRAEKVSGRPEPR